MEIRVAWLTMNPNLGASARSLQDWVLLGKDAGLSSAVVLRQDGHLGKWLRETQTPHTLDPMPWPDRRTPIRSLTHAWKLKRWLAACHVQLIHCYEHDLYPFAVALRALTSLPLVCHVHFTVEPAFASWAFGGARKRPNALVWTSEQQQKDSGDAVAAFVPPRDQYVIPLGLDTARFGSRPQSGVELRQRLQIPPEQIVVAAACALRARKRVDDFLELVRVLQARHSNVVGVLAGGEVPGDEAYARDVTPRIRALEATTRFRWLGHLEPVEPLIQAADVFVSTSGYETFGMSVLEAMACAKPVVAFRGGSVHEVVGKAGLVVEDGDSGALLSAAESLVLDERLRRQLGAAAKRRVEEVYAPRKSLEQLMQLYRSLL